MNIAKWLDTHTPEILARNKAKRREVYGVLVKHPIFYIALALILVGVFSWQGLDAKFYKDRGKLTMQPIML